MTALDRRSLILGALAAPVLARADTRDASAVSLLRPAVPQRAAEGLMVKEINGTRRTLADWAGRPLILNLWAPWCLPCRREMPSLAALAAALKGHRARVLPLAFDWRGAAGVQRFFAEIGVSGLPVLLGEGENLMAVLGIENLPTTVIVSPEGRVVQVVAGEARWDDAATIHWARNL